MHHVYWKLSLATCLSAVLAAAGCGGGATEDPNVVYKPAKEKTVAGNENTTSTNTNNGDSEPTNNGSNTPAPAGGVGTLKGRVVLQGSFTALAPLYEKGDKSVKDFEVCSAEAIPDERLLVGADNGVENVFVYLQKIPAGAKFEPAKDPKYFDQKNCVFEPHCLIMEITQPLMVMSQDPIAHNTHVYPSRSNKDSKTIPGPCPKENAIPFSYGKPEQIPFEVKCDFHVWMKAYHLPLDHPFAAITDKDGQFEIKNLPAGVHKFQVWHESAGSGGYVHRNFEITVEGEDKTTTIEIPYPQEKVSLVGAGPLNSIKLSALLGEE